MIQAKIVGARSLLAVFLMLVALGTSCTAEWAPLPESGRPAAPIPITLFERGALLAGVADVDITPSAGLRLFGHQKSNGVSTGTRMRLHCRVFYFEYAKAGGGANEALAIVPCDLARSSNALQRRVAQRIARDVPVGGDRLILIATQTAGGLADYFDGFDYPGLDERDHPGVSREVTDHLVEAIGQGIMEAHHRAITAVDHACLAWAESSVRDRAHPLANLTRNQHVDAFLSNTFTREERDRFIDRDRPAARALEGTLSVLRIDRCDKLGHSTRPLGVLAVFGVEPAAQSPVDDTYSGDLFGYASREAVSQFGDRFPCPTDVRPTGASKPAAPPPQLDDIDWKTSVVGDPCFTVGLANSAAADVSPIVDSRGTREARRVGSALASEIMRLWHRAEPALELDAPMRVAYRELHPANAEVETDNAYYRHLRREIYNYPGEDWGCGSAVSLSDSIPAPVCRPHLCREAVLGVDGSDQPREDDLASDRSLEIMGPNVDSCHYPKREIHGSFADHRYDISPVAPISAVYLGDRVVTTFPALVTTLAGHRAHTQIERWLASIGRSDMGRVIQITSANADLGVVTTRDEYRHESSESANNLWGPDSARFYANQQLCLTAHLFGAVDDASDQECSLGQGPPGRLGRFSFSHRAAIDVTPSARCASTRHGQFVRVTDLDRGALPTVSARCKGPDIARGTRDGEMGFIATFRPPSDCRSSSFAPRVRVMSEDGHTIDDDQGDGIEVVWSHDGWHIGWYPSPRELSRSGGLPLFFEVTLASIIEPSEPIDPTCR